MCAAERARARWRVAKQVHRLPRWLRRLAVRARGALIKCKPASLWMSICAALLLTYVLWVSVVRRGVLDDRPRRGESNTKSNGGGALYEEYGSHFKEPSLFAVGRSVHPFDQADSLNRTLSAMRQLQQQQLQQGQNNQKKGIEKGEEDKDEDDKDSNKGDDKDGNNNDDDNNNDDGEELMALAFGIQASGESIKLLPRLLARVHSPRNVYAVHLDAKSPSDLVDSFTTLVRSNAAYRANVQVLPSEPLTYKGVSTVLNSLSLMSACLRSRTAWRYYINLSAADYPLVTPSNLARLLGRPRMPDGALNFIMYFPRSEWRPYSFRYRNVVWDAGAGAHYDPRSTVHSTHDSRLFGVRGLRHSPLDPPRAFVFAKAEAWAILSRSFVSFLLHSGFARRMLLAHLHVLSVSEHFVPDVLFNHALWNATGVPDAFRTIVWHHGGRRGGQHPFHLDGGGYANYQKHRFARGEHRDLNAFWHDISTRPSFLARKFAIPDSPLMDRIDREISGAARTTGGDEDGNEKRFRKSRRTFYQRLISSFDEQTKEVLRRQGLQWPSDAYPPLPIDF